MTPISWGVPGPGLGGSGGGGVRISSSTRFLLFLWCGADEEVWGGGWNGGLTGKGPLARGLRALLGLVRDRGDWGTGD